MSGIQIKYCVDDKYFNTQQEAEQYLHDRKFMAYIGDYARFKADEHLDDDCVSMNIQDVMEFIKANKSEVMDYISESS